MTECNDPAFKGLKTYSEENGSFVLLLRPTHHNKLKLVDFRLTFDSSPFKRLADAEEKLSFVEKIPYLDVEQLESTCVPVILSGTTQTVQAVQQAIEFEERLLRELAVFKEKLEHSSDRLAAVLLPLLSGLDEWWCDRTIPAVSEAFRHSFSLPRSIRLFHGPVVSPGRFATATVIAMWNVLEYESLRYIKHQVKTIPDPVWDIIAVASLKAIKTEARTEQFVKNLKNGILSEFLLRVEKQLESVLPAVCSFTIEHEHIARIDELSQTINTKSDIVRMWCF